MSRAPCYGRCPGPGDPRRATRTRRLVSPSVDDAAPDPTGQTAPDGQTRPAPLVVAASIGALEGLALLLLAALEAASVDSERLSLGISTAVFFALTGAAVLGCSWGLLRLSGWARGPLLLAQLMALGLAWNLKDAPLVALVLVGSALVALAGMLHPDTMRALGTLPEDRPQDDYRD